MVSDSKRKLGEILLDHKFITEDQLAQGIEKQKISKKRLGEILTELGFVTQEKWAQALAAQLEKLAPEGPLLVIPPLIKSKRLGEILLNYSLITKDQLAKGIEEQKRTNRRLGEVLTEMGWVNEEKLARALSAQLGIPYVDLNTVVVEPEAIDLLSERLARKNLALPLTVDRKFISVVMADPLDFEAIHDISFATNTMVGVKALPGGRRQVHARVHDRKSPSLPFEWKRVVVEWTTPGGTREAPMRWYGEYLWRADWPADVSAETPARACATDAAGLTSCSALAP